MQCHLKFRNVILLDFTKRFQCGYCKKFQSLGLGHRPPQYRLNAKVSDKAVFIQIHVITDIPQWHSHRVGYPLTNAFCTYVGSLTN